jgi:hypothetical protein
VQVGVRGVDEDRDRRELHDARRSSRLRLSEHHLLGDTIRLRIESDGGGERREAIGGALLILVQLGEQGVGLDPHGVEFDRPPQVRLGVDRALAVHLRQTEAHAHVVAVTCRRAPGEQALKRRDRRVGVPAGEGDLAGQEQRVRLVIRRRLRDGARAFERAVRLADVAGAQRAEAARHPVAAAGRALAR